MRNSHLLIVAALLLFAGCASDDDLGGSLATRSDTLRADSISRARQDSINRASPDRFPPAARGRSATVPGRVSRRQRDLVRWR
jgi:hypothetical protein